MLKQAAGTTALFYVSDHGDNIKDDERGLFGHFLSNEYDLPIPMLFWYSDEYARRFPGKVKAATDAAELPLNTQAVFYSLTDMADIRVDDPSLATRSVFSAAIKPGPRFVLKESGAVDYDAWAREQRASTAKR